MPLDPRIIMQAQQIENPIDMATKAYALKDLVNRGRASDAAYEDQTALKDALSKNTTVGPNGLPLIDRRAVLTALTTGGHGSLATQQSNQWTKDELDRGLQMIQADKQGFAHASPETYAQLHKQRIEMGIPGAEQEPPVWPGQQYINDKLRLAMTAEEQHADHIKNIELGQGQQKADAETMGSQAKMIDAGVPAEQVLGGKYGGRPAAEVTPDTDPAELVKSKVPKAQQEKVFGEIKDAQDINALTPKIMAAFDMASSRNPMISAQGAREFEGLINTTVKEQEGTARQAAFDSIHKNMVPSGLTSLPGENVAKRRTVLEYLKSKASAPVAKGHGIDLSKFNSTSFGYGGEQPGAGGQQQASGTPMSFDQWKASQNE